MKKPLHIVAAENIPYLKEAFESLGTITFLPGRSITSPHLQDTHVLLIRSITRVNEALLEGSPVAFVGSASAGVDHIDTSYLQARNIGFASAAGSNANSVAEYVITALLLLGKQHGFTLAGKTIGIVGVGNIGRLVEQKAQALGMHPVLNDPPLAEMEQIDHHSLQETLACDVVTLHTPLTTEGPYPTYHLLNEHTFKWLKPSTILINAARGEVVDTKVLLDALREKRIGPTVLDVWEEEPTINWDLFQAVTLGTPHIAGHSLDGKANGTYMIYSGLCKHLGLDPTWNPGQSLPRPLVPFLELDTLGQSDEEHVEGIVRQIYDIEADYEAMRRVVAAPPEERPNLFDELRKNYPVRREFQKTRVTIPKNKRKLRKMLEGIGFQEIHNDRPKR